MNDVQTKTAEKVYTNTASETDLYSIVDVAYTGINKTPKYSWVVTLKTDAYVNGSFYSAGSVLSWSYKTQVNYSIIPDW